MMQPVHGIYVALLSGDSFLGHDQKWSDTSWLHHPQVSLCSLFDFILFAAGWGKSFRGWSFCSFQEIHYISLGKWTIIDCIRKNNAMTQKICSLSEPKPFCKDYIWPLYRLSLFLFFFDSESPPFFGKPIISGVNQGLSLLYLTFLVRWFCNGRRWSDPCIRCWSDPCPCIELVVCILKYISVRIQAVLEPLKDTVLLFTQLLRGLTNVAFSWIRGLGGHYMITVSE